MNNSIYKLISESMSSAGLVGYESPAIKKIKLDRDMYAKYKIHEETEFRTIKNILNDKEYENSLLINEDGSDWIGHLSYHPNMKSVFNVFVRNKYRRMGYGKKLMSLYPDCEYLYVKKGNDKAIKLYEKLGFKMTNVFVYMDYNRSADHKIMYNTNKIKSLFRIVSNENDIELYFNINIPKNIYLFTKGYMRDNKLDNNWKPQSNIAKIVPHSDNPSAQLAETHDKCHAYFVYENIDKDTAITINKNDIGNNESYYVHENLQIINKEDYNHGGMLVNKIKEPDGIYKNCKRYAYTIIINGNEYKTKHGIKCPETRASSSNIKIKNGVVVLI